MSTTISHEVIHKLVPPYRLPNSRPTEEEIYQLEFPSSLRGTTLTWNYFMLSGDSRVIQGLREFLPVDKAVMLTKTNGHSSSPVFLKRTDRGLLSWERRWYPTDLFPSQGFISAGGFYPNFVDHSLAIDSNRRLIMHEGAELNGFVDYF